MAKLFRNQYRVQSTRKPFWDYGANGCYFITICTKDMQHCFGYVEKGEMQLNELGNVAEECWRNIPSHFPFVKLGEFIIMPNHVHGILTIDKEEDHILGNYFKLPEAKWGPQSQNIPSIVRGFKIGVTKVARTLQPTFQWQARFHDRIIKDHRELEQISNYIRNNPKNWKKSIDGIQ